MKKLLLILVLLTGCGHKQHQSGMIKQIIATKCVDGVWYGYAADGTRTTILPPAFQGLPGYIEVGDRLCTTDWEMP